MRGSFTAGVFLWDGILFIGRITDYMLAWLIVLRQNKGEGVTVICGREGKGIILFLTKVKGVSTKGRLPPPSVVVCGLNSMRGVLKETPLLFISISDLV